MIGPRKSDWKAINCHLDPTVLDKVRAYLVENDRTLSWFLREAVNSYLEQVEAKAETATK